MPQLFWFFNKIEYDLFKMIVFYRAFYRRELWAALKAVLGSERGPLSRFLRVGWTQASAGLTQSGS